MGIGDCNVIRILDDGGRQYAIMVDCGLFTMPVKDYVINILKKRIDILVVTHIDGDHINGIIKMMSEIPDLAIGHIWYNVYRRHDEGAPIELTEQQNEILSWVKKELPVEFDAINYRREISALQGKSLARSILENASWNRVWEKEYITEETADFELPDGLGKIVFLSPKQNAIQEIEALFKDAFNKYFMHVWDDSIENCEDLSELLLRLTEVYKSEYAAKQISAANKVDMNYIRNQAKTETADDSKTNYSSVAFMLECGNHKIAMLGDAYADTIEDNLKEKYKNEGFPLGCDAIKVSHHGSNGNSSQPLLEIIKSHLYIIPGGKGTDYPTWGTFGRIALSSQDEKMVVFSHRCDMSTQINDTAEEVKQALKVKTEISEKEYELFEW